MPTLEDLAVEERIADEIRAAARWLARRGYKGVSGDPLPDALSAVALERIRRNPSGFTRLVGANLPDVKKAQRAARYRARKAAGLDPHRR